MSRRFQANCVRLNITGWQTFFTDMMSDNKDTRKAPSHVIWDFKVEAFFIHSIFNTKSYIYPSHMDYLNTIYAFFQKFYGQF